MAARGLKLLALAPLCALAVQLGNAPKKVQRRDDNSTAEESLGTARLLRQAAAVRAKTHTEAKSFLAGEKVLMQIESGKRNGTYVPCMLVAKKKNNRFHVRVMAGSAATDLLEIDPSLLKKAPADDTAIEPLIKTFDGDEEAAKMLQHESVVRLRQEWRQRGMNNTGMEKMWQRLQDQLKKEIEMDARQKGCPSGFRILNETRVSGADKISRGLNMKDTVDLCATECSQDAKCMSFLWSPNGKNCMLTKATEPKAGLTKDMMFCRRQAPGEADAPAPARAPVL